MNTTTEARAMPKNYTKAIGNILLKYAESIALEDITHNQSIVLIAISKKQDPKKLIGRGLSKRDVEGAKKSLYNKYLINDAGEPTSKGNEAIERILTGNTRSPR